MMLLLLALVLHEADSTFQDVALQNISFPDRRGSDLAASSSNGVKNIYADWTIIARSTSVTNLGYSLAISGSKVGIAQSTGAYLSVHADKRLFAPGEDKVFVNDLGSQSKTRMAMCTMPKNTNDVQAIAAIGASSVIYVSVLASSVWVQDSKTAEYTTRIMASGGIAEFGRTVAVSDGNVLASGVQTTASNKVGVVVAYTGSYPYKAWAMSSAVLQGGTASFGVSLQFIAAKDGSCRLGQVHQGWKCRMLIGEPDAGKVHIYSMGSDGSWVTEQVLTGPADFGYAISTNEQGPGMVLVGAPSANNQDGLVQVFGYSTQQGKFVLQGALQSPPWLKKGGLGYALDHVTSGTEAIIVTGAPHRGRALIWRTSSLTSFGSSTVLVGVVDGRTRAAPSKPGSYNAMLGSSVAVNGRYVYIGAPHYNIHKTYSSSVGAVHVAAYCWSNQYVDKDGRTKGIGAECLACPGSSTSAGGQSFVCEGCANVPEILPARASITKGCTVSCEVSYNYDVKQNQCLFGTPGTAQGQAENTQAFFVVITLTVVTLMLCCCFCYLLKVLIQHQLIHLGRTTPENLAEVAPQPRLAVRLAAYPMVRVTQGMELPNNAECCVICLDSFKVGARLRILHCEHAFHMPCIDNWLDTHFSCPLCNAQLETEQVPEPQARSHRCQHQRVSAPESTTAFSPPGMNLPRGSSQDPEIEEFEIHTNPAQGVVSPEDHAQEEAVQPGVEEGSSGSRPCTGSSNRVVNVMPSRGVGVHFSSHCPQNSASSPRPHVPTGTH